MHSSMIRILLVTVLVATALAIRADDTASASTNAPSAKSTNSPAIPARPARKTQSDVASKTAVFGHVAKTAADYQSALEAHDLDAAMKQQDKAGAFKGTVTAIFEPRSGGLAIINFDADYRKAMSALLRGPDFTNFPDLKMLVDKEVLIDGKFAAYQGRSEVILTNVSQVKLVEGAK